MSCTCGHDRDQHRSTSNALCDEFGCPCMGFEDAEVRAPMATAARSRFSAIAEEMDERKMEAFDVPRTLGTFDGKPNVLVCVFCGNSAFEPGRVDVPGKGSVPIVMCRACPAEENVRFTMPVGITLDVNRYRCCSCGKQTQVTMTLSEVNLQCGGCRKLTLHTKQSDPKPRVTLQPGRDSAWNSFRDMKSARATPKFMWDDLATPGATADIAAAWQQQVDAIRVRLAFEPFDEFARRMTEANRKRPDISAQDWVRRTGRTTKGLVESIAWCVVLKKPRLYMCSATTTAERWLTKEANALVVAAGVEYPTIIKATDRSRTEEGRIPPDVQLYVDHHWFDADARVGRPDVALVVAPSGKKFWTCSRCGYRREVPLGSDATFPQCSKCS